MESDGFMFFAGFGVGAGIMMGLMTLYFERAMEEAMAIHEIPELIDDTDVVDICQPETDVDVLCWCPVLEEWTIDNLTEEGYWWRARTLFGDLNHNNVDQGHFTYWTSLPENPEIGDETGA